MKAAQVKVRCSQRISTAAIMAELGIRSLITEREIIPAPGNVRNEINKNPKNSKGKSKRGKN